MIKRQKNRKFELVSKFKPAGDQEQAIDKLTAGFKKVIRSRSWKGQLVPVKLLPWPILLPI